MRRNVYEHMAGKRTFHAAVIEPSVYRHSPAPHTHDFYEILYVMRGNGVHLVNDARQHLSAGNLVIVRPSDVHTFKANVATEFTFANVAFPVARWKQLLDYCEVADSWSSSALPIVAEVPLAGRQAVDGAFLEAVAAYHRGPTPLDLARLLPLCLTSPIPSEMLDTSGPRFLQLAMAAMHRQENIALGLNRFVELAGVSHAHLCRTMRRHFHLGPSEFIQDLKLQRAATLLASTRLSVSEIAHEAGFANLSYLHRLFKTRYGKTPLQYRHLSASQVT